ncbi:MAG: phage terminase large subunit [Clostridia bacterium]|nr:phage terminase large subunit [Clostridia bacterium]
MKQLIISEPNEKQKRFFECQNRFIGYGGARGGGKSWALRTKFILLAFNYPNLKLLLLRKTLPELRENHLIPMLSQLNGIARYKKDERAFIFPNGARIRLGYCDSENDIYQYQGQEYDVIGVEECTHFTFSQIQFLMTCNRTTRSDFKPRMYFTGNPGGVGHNWFKRLFVKGNYESGEDENDYTFIPATIDDNFVLMNSNPEYVKVLEALPEKLKQAHRFGNWDIFDGQFFEEFRDVKEHYTDCKNTHIIEPFEIPHDWQIYRSFDFGYAKPFSCGWWAVDYDGRLYRILELYGCTKTANEGVKWPPEKIFSEIARIEKEHRWLRNKNIIGVADPSIWDASRGEAIIESAVRNGVYFNRGDNKRLPGWMQVHYRLSFDENGVPMMYIFNTCKGFIRTIPELKFSNSSPEDLDTTGEDHIADEVRYMCMARPISPVIKKKNEVYGDDPLNLREQKRYRKYSY